MARNSEKQYGRLNRLLLSKEKEGILSHIVYYNYIFFAPFPIHKQLYSNLIYNKTRNLIIFTLIIFYIKRQLLFPVSVIIHS